MSVEPSIGTAATKTIETTIRAVFLDVDGTGADYGVVPEGHVRAVRAAREAGHRVFLCTGRPASMLPESIRGAGFDGLVASAGAYVEIAGEVLVDRRFPADLAARTVAALDRPRPFGELVALELGEGGDDGDHGLSHGPPNSVSGSVVMSSRSERNLMPPALKPSSSSSRWRVFRPSLSSFHTTTSSPLLRRSSILSSSGRLARVPLTPLSR